MKYYTLLNLPYFVYWLGIMIYGILTEPMPSFEAYAMIISWFIFSFVIFFLLSNVLLDYIYDRNTTKNIFIIKTVVQSIVMVIQSYLIFSYGYKNYSGVYHRTFMFDMLFSSIFTIICFTIIHSSKIFISYVQIED